VKLDIQVTSESFAQKNYDESCGGGEIIGNPNVGETMQCDSDREYYDAITSNPEETGGGEWVSSDSLKK